MKFVKTGWLCAVTVAGATALASNEYTTSQDGTVLDVTLTANDAIITDKLSADGVDTLRFTRGGGFYSVKLRSSGGNDLPGGVKQNGPGAGGALVHGDHVLGAVHLVSLPRFILW